MSRLTAAWPAPVVGVVAVLLLTVLDLSGEVTAKEAVMRRSVPIFIAGAVIWLAVYPVFAWMLSGANLSTVTVGWCALGVIGAVAVDRLLYGVRVSPILLLGVGLALGALACVLINEMDGGPAARKADAAARATVTLTQLLGPPPAVVHPRDSAANVRAMAGAGVTR